MIPRACRRLAEVDFPIAEVSRHAVREKSIRHGHPSTLHLWWARRPLASSRAVLLALLLPDPCDPHCPEEFKREARRILLRMQGRPAGWGDAVGPDEGLRRVILQFIADFANWDNAAKPGYLAAGRELVRAAHGEEAPLVVDPFAGGGSIPLEALRLGCDAFASDLNPVACLILKVMLEDIPRHGPGLADELRRIGGEIKKKAKRDLADLYPPDQDGAAPIAYLWARTVRCESPDCGAEIPLIRSFWLCNKAARKRALRPRVRQGDFGLPCVELDLFEPNSHRDVCGSNVIRAKARCLCCTGVLPADRVRAQLARQRGGADVVFDARGRRTGGARMIAVVTLKPGSPGRFYRAPTGTDYEPVHRSQVRLAAIRDEWRRGGERGLCPVPDEPLPPIGTLGFRVQRYGMLRWGDLFTARQAVALSALAAQIAKGESNSMDASILAIGKLVDLGNGLCAWMPGQECPSAVLKLGRVKMSWDFVEGCPLSSSSGSLERCTANLAAGTASANAGSSRTGQAIQAMAQQCPLPDDSSSVFFTDPPYYDAIPYADLADAFLVWMKRASSEHPLLRDSFEPSNPLSPKDQEAVQDLSKSVGCRPKDAAFFNAVMAQAFAEGKRVLRRDGVGAVVFAHQTTEGWEAFLSGMIRGEWTITASWPIATEMPHRIRARDSAALATSVHLICRPRPNNAPVGDWADVLHELPARVAGWMERLQAEGIRGADLVFACIGPALEIFSRYRSVETAEGDPVGLPEYLEKVWEVVGRAALRQVLGTSEAQAEDGLAGALEEDARLTALFLWTLQSTDAAAENSSREGRAQADAPTAATAATKAFSLPYDVARRFAQPMGIDLDTWTGRIIGQKRGVVRLLPVAERAADLFGEDGAANAAAWIEIDPEGSLQQALFPEFTGSSAPRSAGAKGRQRRGRSASFHADGELRRTDATTLDRVHAAMLLQAGGHTNALRALIAAEQERGPAFLRLANALSALYPPGCQEKRLLDAMLLAVPR